MGARDQAWCSEAKLDVFELDDLLHGSVITAVGLQK